MALSLSPPTSFRVPKQQATQATVFPAPLQGMDARVPLAGDNMTVCLWAVNILPTEYAMRVRKGYREWQIGVGSEVRTIIPYVATTQTGAADRLFVAAEDGIYDCTTSGAAPVLKVAFSTQDDDTGRGTYTAYVDEAGKDLLFYADGSNGLFRYDPATDAWAQATGITAAPTAIGTLDVAKINFVMVHKLRVWLIERDANKAWYLPIRSAQGEAKEFFFASKFRHGGELVGLFNWTVDGGAGRDDHLVAISRGGDVIPWTGEDPADGVTWTSTGVFFIGPVPRGAEVASEYGGELFLLSKFGITTMSSLLSGAVSSDPYANQIGHKVARLLRADLAEYGEQHGWGINFVTNLGALVVSTPKRSDGFYRQYVYNISTQGWGLWKGVPMHCGDTWRGALMLGTDEGRVLRQDADADNQLLAGGLGKSIEFFILTSYSYLGAPAVFKRPKFVRPNFVSQTEPDYAVKAYFDYDVDDIMDVPAVQAPTGVNWWDIGVWDEALWSYAASTPYFNTLGVGGIGRAIAIGVAGSAVTQTDLISIDVMYDAGGVL